MKDSSPCNRVAIAALMHRGQWQLAIELIGELASSPQPTCASSSVIWSYLALARCHLTLGEIQPALHWAQRVMKEQPLNTGWSQWLYAHLLAARALRAQGLTDAAIALLTTAYKCSQTNPQINKLLADSLIERYGDWSAARQLWGQITATNSMPRAHALYSIQSQIYNGSAKPEALSQAIFAYTQRYLAAPVAVIPAPVAAPGPTHPTPVRKRLGLASPMFCAGPVYFLCIGALRHLAQEFDLVFFSLGKTQDWATAEFRSLSCEWHEAAGNNATTLASQLRRSRLDVLLDMGGWLAPILLQAMAQRPAPRQYKWVGGQSATTGLATFDGFITDCHQSPPETAALYSEPLACIPGGYVTYTPPPYMPAVQAAHADKQHPARAGVVAHPKKLSAVFLHYLNRQIQAHALAERPAIELCFIGWRYGDALLQQRINQALGLDAQARHGPVSVHYQGGNGHTQQLELVSALDWVVDTFPYTSGVTALEALALGVPIRTHAGQHFSQRHGYSHARFAGLQPNEILLNQLGALGNSKHRRSGRTLLSANCPRLNHVALAHSLAQLFSGSPNTSMVQA